MARKEDINKWLEKNGLTKKEVKQMWKECCKINVKCRLLDEAGKSWKDLPMSQIEKIPTYRENMLKSNTENTTESSSTETTNNAAAELEEMSESERLFQKIKNKEYLSESEIRSLLWDYGCEVDEIEGGAHRWTQSVSTIIELCGQYVRIDWQRGLTEMQENIYDEQPYFVEKKKRVIQKVVVDWNKINLDKESENDIEEEDMYK